MSPSCTHHDKLYYDVDLLVKALIFCSICFLPWYKVPSPDQFLEVLSHALPQSVLSYNITPRDMRQFLMDLWHRYILTLFHCIRTVCNLYHSFMHILSYPSTLPNSYKHDTVRSRNLMLMYANNFTLIEITVAFLNNTGCNCHNNNIIIYFFIVPNMNKAVMITLSRMNHN